MGWLRHFQHWLAVHVGIGSSPTAVYWYSFWSGSGSDIGELAIVGAVLGVARHHNCHVKGCWRLGGHQVDGTPYRVCKTHHPTIDESQRVTADTVQAAHEATKETVAGG